MPRYFVDENSLAVGKALAAVRDDVAYPGAPGCPVKVGMADRTWLPIVGGEGLIVLSRDKRIRQARVEIQTLLDNDVRAFFLTSGGNLTRFEQLALWMRYWDAMERLVAQEEGPWLASVTRVGVKLFPRRGQTR